MTTRTHRLAFRRTALRLAAATALAGAALVGQQFMAHADSPAIPMARMVQATPPAATPAQTRSAAGAVESRPETIEQRIASLHTALKITADEETNWTGVAVAMRENAGAMEKLVASKAARDPKATTAVDDLKTYQMFAQTHVDGLKNLTAAFEKLYQTMPDSQKKIADGVFAGAGRGRGAHG